jgi:hypothetical protein
MHRRIETCDMRMKVMRNNYGDTLINFGKETRFPEETT